LSAKKTGRQRKRPRKASQRWPNIRSEIQGYIDQLVELYEITDPARGTASEEDKLEHARRAVELWWYLFGELLLWAQSQLVGYEIAKANPEFRENLSRILGHEVTSDSHALEYVGLGYSWNRVNYDDPIIELIESAMEKYNGLLDSTSLRLVIRELLSSRSANSSFWRFELRSALYALNLGQSQPLTTPEPIRRQGDAVQLLSWKVMALQHVHFQMGKGMKKYRALQMVADKIGQSTETIRSWEKFVSNDDDLTTAIEAAHLAARLENELDKFPVDKLIEKYGAEYHRNTSDIEYAMVVLRDLRTTPLSKVREGLRSGRMGKVSGR
jgi:hypothetical protein